MVYALALAIVRAPAAFRDSVGSLLSPLGPPIIWGATDSRERRHVTRTAAAPILASAGLLTLSLSLAAQNVPARPPLDGADTNHAAAYYQYGLSVLAQDPFKAADAFYWASRIDPTWAQPLYAGRIAYLMGADDHFVIG